MCVSIYLYVNLKVYFAFLFFNRGLRTTGEPTKETTGVEEEK